MRARCFVARAMELLLLLLLLSRRANFALRSVRKFQLVGQINCWCAPATRCDATHRGSQLDGVPKSAMHARLNEPVVVYMLLKAE